MIQALRDKFQPNQEKPQQVALEETVGKKLGGMEEENEVTGPQHPHLEDRTKGDNMEEANV